MKKIALYFTLLTALCVLFVMPVQAQNKKLDAYSIATNYELYPKHIWVIDWIPGTTDLAYTKDFKNLIKVSYPSKTTTTIVTLSDLNEKITAFTSDSDRDPSTMGRFPFIEWTGTNTFIFEYSNMYFSYDIIGKNLTKLNSWTTDAEVPDFCKANNIMAYTKGNNLYLSVNGKEIAVTNETDEGIKMCNYVHREEFGITKGTFWSPKGSYLAFYRMDESLVTSYPIVDVTTRIAIVDPEKYPMAGMTSHHVTLGIYNIQTGKTIYANTGEPEDQYLTSITWSPDEQFIFIGLLNRGQNHLKLNMYDALTGEFVQTLFEEKSDKYVEPLDPMFFVPGQNTQFLWFSQRDGYRHLYLYDTKGKMLKQLTSGNWIVNDIIGFDNKNTQVFIHATKDSPIEKHVYSVSLKNGSIKKITAEPGEHTGLISDNGNYCIDDYSSQTIANRIDIQTADGKKLETLHEDKNCLKSYSMPTTEIFTLQNDNGDDLYCRIIKPADFDATKKYPVIVYVYGGPHAQLITNSWLGGSGLFLNFLAQQGYIVFSLDNRGSSNRGFAFESATHRNLGEKEAEDQMVGVKYLQSLSYVDSERIGVHGWSYGGFMTINLMLRYPEVFKTGVAGGPVCDWQYYEVMYGERYMGTPENNPIGYENASLVNKAELLEGRLLIIHGGIDPVVVLQHSLMFIENSIKARKQVDFFIYPTHEHNVGGPDRGHLHEKIYQYFNDFL